tara:strand:+ start:159 stop:920 length:762 start_codon:yes stop_codon:yes gene_type:complete
MLLSENEIRTIVSASILLESFDTSDYTAEEKLLLQKHQRLVEIREANDELQSGLISMMEELEARDRLAEEIMIQEGLLDGFTKIWDKISGGWMKDLKKWIEDMIADGMGISADPDAFMRKVLHHFMKDVGIMELKDMITGSNKCLTVSTKLADAVVKVFVEKAPDIFDLEDGKPMATSIQKALKSAATVDFSKKLALAFCKIDFRDLVRQKGGKVGDMLAKFIGKPAYGADATIDSVEADMKASKEGSKEKDG